MYLFLKIILVYYNIIWSNDFNKNIIICLIVLGGYNFLKNPLNNHWVSQQTSFTDEGQRIVDIVIDY